MKKTWILLVISILCLGVFTACTSNADVMPSPMPIVSSTPSAAPTTMPTTAPTASASPMAEAGANTVEDAMRVSDRVAEEVEKLSELDTAQAVVAGNIALVGIRYDAQYQGGLTDRLIDMADSRVMAIDKTITAVHVTDDTAMVEKIKMLRDKLEKKELTFEQLQAQVLEISSGIAGGKNTDVSQPQSTTGA